MPSEGFFEHPSPLVKAELRRILGTIWSYFIRNFAQNNFHHSRNTLI